MYLTHILYFFLVVLQVQFNISPQIRQLLNGLSCSRSKLQFQIIANKMQRFLIYMFFALYSMCHSLAPCVLNVSRRTKLKKTDALFVTSKISQQTNVQNTNYMFMHREQNAEQKHARKFKW